MDFTPITAADRQEPYVAPQTLRDRGWRRMKGNPLALWGMAIVIVMTLLAVIGPFYPLIPMPIRAWPMPTPGRRRHTGSVPIRSDEISLSASCMAPAFPCPSAW